MAALPYSRALTVEDLAGLPDDGHRYELVDGSLVVTPAPHRRHQRAVMRLGVLLTAAIPDGLEVLPAPYEWRLSNDTAVQPDLVVCERSDDAYQTIAPILVVEVLSPSTRRFDLLAKRDVYDEGGVTAYWIVDPDEPSVTVLGRRAGRLGVLAEARGDEELTVEEPFAVRVRPSDLVR